MSHLDADTLEALWLGTLDEPARVDARAHLDGCAACRTAFAALEEELAPLTELGTGLPPLAAPPLEADLPLETRRASWTRIAFGPGLWRAAALALLLLGAGWALRRPASNPAWTVVSWRTPARVLAIGDGRRAAPGDGLQLRLPLAQGGDTLVGGLW